MDAAADSPVEGYYLMRVVRNGPFVPVKIWHGPSPDPDFSDNPMDRSSHWHARVDGKEMPIAQAWPWAGRNPIDEAEYKFRRADSAHARTYRPDDPAAKPTEPIDLSKTPPLF